MQYATYFSLNTVDPLVRRLLYQTKKIAAKQSFFHILLFYKSAETDIKRHHKYKSECKADGTDIGVFAF